MGKPIKPGPDRPRRGRPPSAAGRAAILRAARELLAQGGPAAITMEGVAARAGVGKPTVYRWWPDRHAVAMAALMDDEPFTRPGPPRRSPLHALRRQLHGLVDRFSTPVGRHAVRMIASAPPGSDMARAFRNQVVLTRRAEGAVLLGQAYDAGEIAHEMDVDVMADLLYGAVFFRVLIGHEPLDIAFVDAVLDHVLRGFTR